MSQNTKNVNPKLPEISKALLNFAGENQLKNRDEKFRKHCSRKTIENQGS